MTWRVDFVDRFTYSVQHSLSLADGLDNIRLNADKIAGTSYFAKEPRRVEFECFKDDWLDQKILSGEHEYDRYISYYLVRLYEGSTLVFHGVIDTSFVSHNAKTDVVSFTCYDYLRLFAKFDDQTMLYALHSGYSADYCFRYLAQGIEVELGNEITIPCSWYGYTPLQIAVEGLEILQLDWLRMVRKFRQWNGSLTCYCGFRYAPMFSGDYVPEFRLLFYCEHVLEGNIQCKVYARKFRFYNAICWVEDSDAEIDEKSEIFSTGDYDEMLAWRDELCAEYVPFEPWASSRTFHHNSNTYSIGIADADLDDATAPEYKYVTYTGNAIPANLYPKGFYEGENEPLEKLKALKAALLLHNLTIVSLPSGTLRLVNKDDASNTVTTIDSADVIEFKRKRLNRSRPDTSVLDCLVGDTTNLKALIADYYETLFCQTWSLEATVDNLAKYDFALFDKLLIKGVQYRITELQRDPKADEYKLKAWEV